MTEPLPTTEDPRIAAGMAKLLARRAAERAAGDHPCGWKLGLGTEAAMTRLSLSGPLVGYLTDRRTLAPASACDISAWAQPLAEPEVAVHLVDDVPADADLETATSAIGGIGPAIELVDIDAPMDDVEAMLAGNIFHRHVILGPTFHPGGEPRSAIVEAPGQPPQTIANPEEIVGTPGAAVLHVARTLAPLGETLRAGDVIITGSLTPPIPVAAGDELAHRLGEHGDKITVTLR